MANPRDERDLSWFSDMIKRDLDYMRRGDDPHHPLSRMVASAEDYRSMYEPRIRPYGGDEPAEQEHYDIVEVRLPDGRIERRLASKHTAPPTSPDVLMAHIRRSWQDALCRGGYYDGQLLEPSDGYGLETASDRKRKLSSSASSKITAAEVNDFLRSLPRPEMK